MSFFLILKIKKVTQQLLFLVCSYFYNVVTLLLTQLLFGEVTSNYNYTVILKVMCPILAHTNRFKFNTHCMFVRNACEFTRV